jgi:diguanylate cyclase (GGDEF)-like protein/PAS domain S-box-containing protein
MAKRGPEQKKTPQSVSVHGALPWEDAARLRLIADNIPAMSVAYDEKLICRFANRRFAEFFDHTSDSIVGRHLREIIGEAPYREVKPAFDRVLAGTRTAYTRKRVMPDGSHRYIDVELIPYMGEDGRSRGVFSVTTDVTDRRREEQLRALGLSVAGEIAGADSSRTAVRAVIREICRSEGWDCGRYLRPHADGSLRLEEDWGIDEPGVQRFLELARGATYPKGGIAGSVMASGEATWVTDTHADPRALLHPHFKNLSPRGSFAFPVKAGGQTVGVLAFNSRERRPPDEGLLSMIVALGAQIGEFLERKRAEDELREERARLRTIVDSANEAILVYDREARIVSVNGAAERILGVPKERLIGAAGFVAVLPCVDENGVPIAQQGRASARAVQHGTRVTGRIIGIRHESGLTTWVTANSAPLYDPERSGEPYGAVTTLTDITRLKRAEALARLEQRVARDFDAAPDVASALRAAVQAICEAERWDTGRYLEMRGSQLRHLTDWHFDDPVAAHYLELARGVEYRLGHGVVGHAWQDRVPVWVEDIERDTRAARGWTAAADAGVRSALAVPVLAQDELIGVFMFTSRERRQPDETLLQALQVVGGQIGQLVRRAKAEAAVRASEARFRSLCELSSDIFWEQDAQFRFTALTDWAGRLEPQEMLGRRRWEISYTNVNPGDWEAHRAVLEAHQPFRDLELGRRGADGQEVWYSVSGEPVLDDAGQFTGYRGVGRDITARKADERRIRHLASHDDLTALPNRTAFSEILNGARAMAARHGRALAVMFVDLDRFKLINDTLGHEVGDQVLAQAARRLRETLRSSDVVARLGGDEFVVVIPELEGPPQAEAAARKVLAALSRPVMAGGQELSMTASVGIALYPQDGVDTQALMKAADTAMYRAKESGRNNFKFHHREADRRSIQRLAMENALRRALERKELVLHYQPRVSVETGQVLGAEALIRWQHPDLGLVPPVEFIPLAEETGMIVDIGRWAIDTACAQAAAWRAQGLAPLRMAVNVSARQFSGDDLARHVSETIAARGLPAEFLELEITESLVAESVERAAQVLARIRALGVRVALDDFGTGYSSLAQLKRFPIDILKVDRSFVSGLPEDSESAAIARAIIAMGKSLRMQLVAEGVETWQQHAFLQAHGCDEMQGYLISRAMPAAQFEEFVRRPAG